MGRKQLCEGEDGPLPSQQRAVTGLGQGLEGAPRHSRKDGPPRPLVASKLRLLSLSPVVTEHTSASLCPFPTCPRPV